MSPERQHLNPYAAPASQRSLPWPGFDEYYRRQSSRQALPTLGALMLPSLVWAFGAQIGGYWDGTWHHAAAFSILLIGVGSTLGLYLLVANFVFIFPPRVAETLREILIAGEPSLDNQGAVVLFSPGDRFGYFEMRTAYDVGILVTAREHLVYVGEKTSWALRRSDIRAIALGPGCAELGPFPHRIFIDWRDPDSGEVRTGNLGVVGYGSLLTARLRMVPELWERLDRWWYSGVTGGGLPPALTELPAPNRDLPQPVSPRQLLLQGHILVGMLFVAAMSALLESLCASAGKDMRFSGVMPLATGATQALIILPAIWSRRRR